MPSKLTMVYECTHFILHSWLCGLAEFQPPGLDSPPLAQLDEAGLQISSWVQVCFSHLYSKTPAKGAAAPLPPPPGHLLPVEMNGNSRRLAEIDHASYHLSPGTQSSCPCSSSKVNPTAKRGIQPGVPRLPTLKEYRKVTQQSSRTYNSTTGKEERVGSNNAVP